MWTSRGSHNKVYIDLEKRIHTDWTRKQFETFRNIMLLLLYYSVIWGNKPINSNLSVLSASRILVLWRTSMPQNTRPCSTRNLSLVACFHLSPPSTETIFWHLNPTRIIHPCINWSCVFQIKQMKWMNLATLLWLNRQLRTESNLKCFTNPVFLVSAHDFVFCFSSVFQSELEPVYLFPSTLCKLF